MPTWSEYKVIAKERGSLALEVFVVQSRLEADPSTIPTVLPDHLAYLKTLEASGKLMMAGPLSDEAGEMNTGDGMLVLQVASLQEAHEVAAGDPMHTTGTRSFTVRPWLVNEGGFSINIGLSAQSVSFG